MSNRPHSGGSGNRTAKRHAQKRQEQIAKYAAAVAARTETRHTGICSRGTRQATVRVHLALQCQQQHPEPAGAAADAADADRHPDQHVRSASAQRARPAKAHQGVQGLILCLPRAVPPWRGEGPRRVALRVPRVTTVVVPAIVAATAAAMAVGHPETRRGPSRQSFGYAGGARACGRRLGPRRTADWAVGADDEGECEWDAGGGIWKHDPGAARQLFEALWAVQLHQGALFALVSALAAPTCGRSVCWRRTHTQHLPSKLAGTTAA